MVTLSCNEVSYDKNSVRTLISINATESDSRVQSTIDVLPKLDIAVKKDASIESKIAKLLATMTLEQKVAQMIQPEIRDITVDVMCKYGFGSFPTHDKHAMLN